MSKEEFLESFDIALTIVFNEAENWFSQNTDDQIEMDAKIRELDEILYSTYEKVAELI